MSERFAPQQKLAASPRLVDFIKGKFVMPINVEISPSGPCNAKCPWCFYMPPHGPGFDKDFLSVAVMEELFADFVMDEVGNLLVDDVVKAVTWTGGGDPSLNPHFDELVQMAFDYGVKQGLITNGYKVKYDPTLLEWVRVSLTDKPWPIDSLKKLRACKTLGMNINYLGKGQDDEVKKSLQVAYDVGADYLEVRPALVLNGGTTHIEEPNFDDPKLKKIGYKFEDAGIPHGTCYTKCQGYHFVPFIWHDGNVDVCAYHRRKGGVYTLGNIYKEGFRSIMKRAPQYVDVIPECQVCCKNHEINKLINGVQNLKDEDFV